MMILAMVAASVLTHAWDRSTYRCREAWRVARAQREQARARRTAARAERLRAAKTRGPRDVLWWPYAAGWVLAGIVRAGVAGVAGAREGGPVGAREGRRFAHTAAQRGWSARRAWREYHRRRGQRPTSPDEAPQPGEAAGSTRGHRDDLVAQPCPACGVWTAELVGDREPGWVCEPCARWRAEDGQPPQREQPGVGDPGPGHDPGCSDGLIAGYRGCPDCIAQLRHDGHSGTDEQLEALLIDRGEARWSCDGLCTNSDLDFGQAAAHGLCAGCGGRGDLVWNFGAEHGHTPCPE